MNWATIVGKITGTVDQHLIERCDYILTENRILRGRIEWQPQFTDFERITLAKAAKPLGRTILGEIATLVTPDTLLRRHRRLVEGKLPANANTKIGRPRTGKFARENPSWGYDRIVGALKDLGHAISDSTVGNMLREHAEPPAPERKNGKSWADFIATHKEVLVGCDFFTKEVRTLTGVVNYYVLFFIRVASRKIHVAGFTANPNERWMKQIARNITMADGGGFLNGIKYLILYRDTKLACSFREIIESAGVEILRLPPKSLNLNAFAERFVRSIKEECLDHFILFDEPSLQRAIDNFIEHYHRERPHQGKNNVLLFPVTPDSNPARAGPVECKHRLGGLLKFYHRKAA